MSEVTKTVNQVLAARVSQAAVDDAAYLQAVEEGDLFTLQQMVKEAARGAGYTIGPVYHGGTFNLDTASAMNPGSYEGTIFFAASEADADYFGSGSDQFMEQGKDYHITPAYLTGNIFDVDNKAHIKQVASWAEDNDVELDEIEQGDYTSFEDTGLIPYLKELGFEGFTTYEGNDGKSYGVFNPWQVKSAEPVTWDDAGEVIPLSKRFNKSTTDVRAMKTPNQVLAARVSQADIGDRISKFWITPDGEIIDVHSGEEHIVEALRRGWAELPEDLALAKDMVEEDGNEFDYNNVDWRDSYQDYMEQVWSDLLSKGYVRGGRSYQAAYIMCSHAATAAAKSATASIIKDYIAQDIPVQVAIDSSDWIITNKIELGAFLRDSHLTAAAKQLGSKKRKSVSKVLTRILLYLPEELYQAIQTFPTADAFVSKIESQDGVLVKAFPIEQLDLTTAFAQQELADAKTDYAAGYARKSKDPVRIFLKADTNTYEMIDGYHRLYATQEQNKDTISATVEVSGMGKSLHSLYQAVMSVTAGKKRKSVNEVLAARIDSDEDKLQQLKNMAALYASAPDFIKSFYKDDWSDQIAFGYINGTQPVDPKLLKIKWHDDWRNADPFDVPVDQTPPIEVVYEKSALYVEDGHHRLKSALKQDAPSVWIDLTIKQSPFTALPVGGDADLKNVWEEVHGVKKTADQVLSSRLTAAVYDAYSDGWLAPDGTFYHIDGDHAIWAWQERVRGLSKWAEYSNMDEDSDEFSDFIDDFRDDIFNDMYDHNYVRITNTGRTVTIGGELTPKACKFLLGKLSDLFSLDNSVEVEVGDELIHAPLQDRPAFGALLRRLREEAGLEVQGMKSINQVLSSRVSNMSDRLKRLYERRGENPDGTINESLLTPVAAGVSLAKRSSKQTDSPEFKAWFGDSKVVDEDGQPIVVYHGSQNPDMQEFADGRVAYFTDSHITAQSFSDRSFMGESLLPGEVPTVYAAVLKLLNPLVITDEAEYEKRFQDSSIDRDALIAQGYDGMMYLPAEGDNYYMTFNPGQIRIIAAEKTAAIDSKKIPKDKDVFNYDPISKDMWYDLFNEAADHFQIHFNLENNDPIKGEQRTLTFTSDAASETEYKVSCQLWAAGGDWEWPSLYFRCQLLSGTMELDIKGNEGLYVSPHTKDAFFVLIPPLEGGNTRLMPSEDGGWVSIEDQVPSEDVPELDYAAAWKWLEDHFQNLANVLHEHKEEAAQQPTDGSEQNKEGVKTASRSRGFYISPEGKRIAVPNSEGHNMFAANTYGKGSAEMLADGFIRVATPDNGTFNLDFTSHAPAAAVNKALSYARDALAAGAPISVEYDGKFMEATTKQGLGEIIRELGLIKDAGRRHINEVLAAVKSKTKQDTPTGAPTVDTSSMLFRGLGRDEAYKSAEAGHLVYYSRDPMSNDWEVIKYSLGDDASRMTEEEIEAWEDEVVPWKPQRQGVNLTRDFSNALDYAEGYVACVTALGDVAEFGGPYRFAKEPSECVVNYIYDTKKRKYFTPAEFVALGTTASFNSDKKKGIAVTQPMPSFMTVEPMYNEYADKVYHAVVHALQEEQRISEKDFNALDVLMAEVKKLFDQPETIEGCAAFEANGNRPQMCAEAILATGTSKRGLLVQASTSNRGAWITPAGEVFNISDYSSLPNLPYDEAEHIDVAIANNWIPNALPQSDDNYELWRRKAVPRLIDTGYIRINTDSPTVLAVELSDNGSAISDRAWATAADMLKTAIAEDKEVVISDTAGTTYSATNKIELGRAFRELRAETGKTAAKKKYTREEAIEYLTSDAAIAKYVKMLIPEPYAGLDLDTTRKVITQALQEKSVANEMFTDYVGAFIDEDAETVPATDFDEIFYRILENMVHEVEQVADIFYIESEYEVWRAIAVEDVEANIKQLQETGTTVDHTGVGEYWASNENHAEAHWGRAGTTIVLHGKVPAEAINWERTLYARICNDEEWELYIPAGTPIHLIDIIKPGGTVVIDKQVTADLSFDRAWWVSPEGRRSGTGGLEHNAYAIEVLGFPGGRVEALSKGFVRVLERGTYYFQFTFAVASAAFKSAVSTMKDAISGGHSVFIDFNDIDYHVENKVELGRVLQEITQGLAGDVTAGRRHINEVLAANTTIDFDTNDTGILPDGDTESVLDANIASTGLTREQILEEYASAHVDGGMGLYPGYINEPDDAYADYVFQTKELAEQEADMVLDMFDSLPEPTPIYRALAVKSPDEIDFDNLGVYWSMDKNGAIQFGSHAGATVLLEAMTSKDNIDFAASVKAFVQFSSFGDGESEMEVTLKDDSSEAIQDIRVYDWRGTKLLRTASEESDRSNFPSAYEYQNNNQEKVINKTAKIVSKQTDSPEFKSWFAGSLVVDGSGNPQVVYRGQHGNTEDIQSRLPSITFVADPEVASTYAMEPNNRSEEAEAPKVIAAYLSIKNPVINNPDEPYVDFVDLIANLGAETVAIFAKKHQAYIINTNNWDENFSRDYGDVEELLTAKPEALKDLYMDAYPLLDDPEFVAAAKAAGYDGAIHTGNGASSDALEYRVFSKEQIKSAIGNFNRTAADKKKVVLTRQENYTLSEENSMQTKSDKDVTRYTVRLIGDLTEETEVMEDPEGEYMLWDDLPNHMKKTPWTRYDFLHTDDRYDEREMIPSVNGQYVKWEDEIVLSTRKPQKEDAFKQSPGVRDMGPISQEKLMSFVTKKYKQANSQSPDIKTTGTTGRVNLNRNRGGIRWQLADMSGKILATDDAASVETAREDVLAEARARGIMSVDIMGEGLKERGIKTGGVKSAARFEDQHDRMMVVDFENPDEYSEKELSQVWPVPQTEEGLAKYWRAIGVLYLNTNINLSDFKDWLGADRYKNPDMSNGAEQADIILEFLKSSRTGKSSSLHITKNYKQSDLARSVVTAGSAKDVFDPLKTDDNTDLMVAGSAAFHHSVPDRAVESQRMATFAELPALAVAKGTAAFKAEE